VAVDIPALWTAPTTTDADRKEILRQVLDRVEVDAQDASERVWVTLHWAGGEPTAGEVVRPIRHTAALSDYSALCARVRALAAEGWSAAVIAQRLADEGFRPPRGAAFSSSAINDLRRPLGLPAGRARRWPPRELAADEWWAGDLAAELAIPKGTLMHWVRRGGVRARRQGACPHRWIVWADAAERERLRQLRARSVADDLRQQWLGRPVAGPSSPPHPIS